MQDKIIALIVVLVIGVGLVVLFLGPKSENLTDGERQAIVDLDDCRANVYSKPAYAPIRSHLPAPENKFLATDLQMAESSIPTPSERKLLAAYNSENTACKMTALKTFETSNPEQAAKLKDIIEKANAVMQQLIDGNMTWGEAATKLDTMRTK